jgi:hypothetical protein
MSALCAMAAAETAAKAAKSQGFALQRTATVRKNIRDQ